MRSPDVIFGTVPVFHGLTVCGRPLILLAGPAQFSSIAGGWILSNSENPYALDYVSHRFHTSSVGFETASLFTGLTKAVISSTCPVQDGISALGQAHTRLIPCQKFPHVALVTVPVSACLTDSNSPQLVLLFSSVEFSSFAQRWLHLGKAPYALHPVCQCFALASRPLEQPVPGLAGLAVSGLALSGPVAGGP